jgi:Zn-dependent protease with chaperone function
MSNLLSSKRIFPNLHPSNFQHPLDVSATESLSKIPLLPTVLNWLNARSFEQIIRQRNLENTIRLGKNQGGSIYEAFEYACHILDIKQVPELFIQNQPFFNAYATGTERHSIVLTSSLIDALDEDEILAVIGHELGHIKCEHMLYKNVSYLLALFGMELIRELIPGVGQAAGMAIGYAFTHWARKAELSCDRAALLVSQDINTVTNLIMLMAAGSRKLIPELNLEAVLEQAEDLQEMENTLIGKLVLVQELNDTHPVPIRRCVEISKWATSGQYQRIIAGEYEQVTP